MAILIITATIAGACQLLGLVAAQRRIAEYRALASLEATNVMEDLLSRRWNELTAEAPQTELSQICRQRLPAPQLRVQVAKEEADANSRRISVEIDWLSPDGGRAQPIRLVAWRYQPAESQR